MNESNDTNFKQVVRTSGPDTRSETKKVRRRSPTLLKMQWLAERVRKTEKIRKQVLAGDYQVDSTDIAKAMLNKDLG